MTMRDIKQSRKLPATSPLARDSLCKVTTMSLGFKFMHPVSHGVSALAVQTPATESPRTEAPAASAVHWAQG